MLPGFILVVAGVVLLAVAGWRVLSVLAMGPDRSLIDLREYRQWTVFLGLLGLALFLLGLASWLIQLLS